MIRIEFAESDNPYTNLLPAYFEVFRLFRQMIYTCPKHWIQKSIKWKKHL